MFNANTASPSKLQRGAGAVAVSGQRRHGTPLPPLRLPWRHRAEIKEMAQPLILDPECTLELVDAFLLVDEFGFWYEQLGVSSGTSTIPSSVSFFTSSSAPFLLNNI
ncbi:hypothetical protein J6590_096972 [Homalodisca vitripennis]|nr:hypothetical protein J6590_096972 [Homalodisca vitripennis]